MHSTKQCVGLSKTICSSRGVSANWALAKHQNLIEANRFAEGESEMKDIEEEREKAKKKKKIFMQWHRRVK